MGSHVFGLQHNDEEMKQAQRVVPTEFVTRTIARAL
jgi:hypothetical protein